LRAVFLEEFGGDLKIQEVDKPSPGRGEVLVKIIRTGVCYRDILTVDGFFPRAKLPLILGHEIAGIVEEVGGDVEDVSVGDTVVSLPYVPCGECQYCRSGRENICINRRWYGEVLDGSYSEYILLDKRSIVKVEGEVDWNYLAISACVIGMLIHAIEDFGGIGDGSKVLVTGASGGVGIHAIQISKIYGADVIAVTSSEDKVKFIESVSPDHIIVSKGDFSRDVKELTGGVDLVLETVGGPTFKNSLKSLKWGGRLALIGNVTVESPSLQLGLMILRENLIHGVISSTRRTLMKAIDYGLRGLVKAIGQEMSLWNIGEAHRILREGRSRGRVFLKP